MNPVPNEDSVDSPKRSCSAAGSPASRQPPRGLSSRPMAERATVRFVEERRDDLEDLWSRFHVRRLDLFGSAVTGLYRPGDSDLDFLVDFRPLPVGVYADSFFGLHEELERLFGRPVDLVVASAIKNPYFRQSVEQTRALLYAA